VSFVVGIAPKLRIKITVSGQFVDVVRLVLRLLVPNHFVQGLGVENDGVVEVSRVDGDVDGEVEQVEVDLGEVERGQLVVLADFLREFCGVDSEKGLKMDFTY
jgi:hypothetical protein